MKRDALYTAISAKLSRAYAKHGCKSWNRREFYAILQGEVDELWDAIKADASTAQVLSELTQVAAMCFRYVETRE